MSEDLHAEVVALLDGLRDKTLAAQERWWQLCEGDVGHVVGVQQHIAAWSPAAVLLLVGDQGLLRRQAAAFHRRTGDGLLSLVGQCDGETDLIALQDTLRAMRDAT